MSKLSTWTELAESDLVLNMSTIEDFVGDYGGTVALIKRDADDRLRLEWGAIIHGAPHQVKHEVMIVVQEGEIKYLEDGVPYLPYKSCGQPHLRVARTLGLAGTPDRTKAASVCVPLDREHLEQIEFTGDPAPLQQWESDLLTGR